MDQSEQTAVGYLPEGVDGQSVGRSTDHSIAGGDVRIFTVRVKESGVEEIPHVAPPPRPRGVVLPLRHARSIKEEILSRPTFFEHFDGVGVDWRTLHERERAALQAEAGWMRRQGLRVYVDLSSGVDLYPTLRLIDNVAADHAASMAAITDVLGKMEILGARDLILSLHRHPENNFTGGETDAAFEQTLRALATQAAERQVTLHLRLAFGKPPWGLGDAGRLLDKVGAPNLRLAVSTALLASAEPSAESAQMLKDKLGLWLVAAPRTDIAGKLWDAHAPIHQAMQAGVVARWLALAPETPRLLDAVYADRDEEYLDAVALRRLVEKP